MRSSGINVAPYNGYFNYCMLIVKLTSPADETKKKDLQGRLHLH